MSSTDWLKFIGTQHSQATSLYNVRSGTQHKGEIQYDPNKYPMIEQNSGTSHQFPVLKKGPNQQNLGIRNNLRTKAVQRMESENFRGAVDCALESIRFSEQLPPGMNTDIETLPEYILLAKAYAKLGDAGEGKFYLDQARNIAKRQPYSDPVMNASLYNILAELYVLYGDIPTAELIYDGYCSRIESAFGLDHIATSDCYNLLASFYTHQGKYVKALGYCNKALTIRVNQLGHMHLCTADSHYNMGLLHRLNGNHKDAKEQFQFAFDVRSRTYGAKSLEVAEIAISIGFTDHQMGNLENAHRYYEMAFLARAQLLGRKHVDSVEALNLLNSVRVSLGKPKYEYDAGKERLGQVVADATSLTHWAKASGDGNAATSSSTPLSTSTPLYDSRALKDALDAIKRDCGEVPAKFEAEALHSIRVNGPLSGLEIRAHFGRKYAQSFLHALIRQLDGGAVGDGRRKSGTRYNVLANNNANAVAIPPSPISTQHGGGFASKSAGGAGSGVHHGSRGGSGQGGGSGDGAGSGAGSGPGPGTGSGPGSGPGTGSGSGPGTGSGTYSSDVVSSSSGRPKKKLVLAKYQISPAQFKASIDLINAHAVLKGSGPIIDDALTTKLMSTVNNFTTPTFTGADLKNSDLKGQVDKRLLERICLHVFQVNHKPTSGSSSKRSSRRGGASPEADSVASVHHESKDDEAMYKTVGDAAVHPVVVATESGGTMFAAPSKPFAPGSNNANANPAGQAASSSSGPVSGYTESNNNGGRTKQVDLSGKELWQLFDKKVTTLGIFPMLVMRHREAMEAAKMQKQQAAAQQSRPPMHAGLAAQLQGKQAAGPPGGGAKPVARKAPTGPKSDLKRLHWDVLDDTTGTIWDSADVDLSIEDVFSNLKEEFTTKPTKPKGGATDEPEKPKEVILVPDPKRRQNMSIFVRTLTKGGRGLEDVAKSLSSMDTEAFDVGSLTSFVEFMPAAEETALVQNYLESGGDVQLLGPAENFILAMKDVKRLSARVSSLKFKATFTDLVSDLESHTDTLLHSCAHVQSSKRFTRLLGIVLKLGNELNKGTYKGGATGIKLSSLMKLTQTKTNKNITLLEYLITNLWDREAEMLKFHEDMPELEAATKCSMQTMNADLGKLRIGVRQIANTVKTASDDVAYVEAMSGFLEQSQLVFDAIEAKYKKMTEDFASLCKYVGEDGKMKPEELFGLLRNFISVFKATCKKIEEQKERKERQLKRDAEKKKMQDRIKGDGSSSGGNNNNRRSLGRKPIGADGEPTVTIKQQVDVSGEDAKPQKFATPAMLPFPKEGVVLRKTAEKK